MLDLNNVIDMVEVGMLITVYREENCCVMSGFVTKKLLIHDAETHEEYYHLEMDVDGMQKTITDIDLYQVFSLFNKNGKDILKERRKRLRKRYFPADGYMDDEVPVVFREMINAWNDSSEADREDLAEILFEKMDARDLKEIMDEVSESQNDLDEDDGFYDIDEDYDEDDDLDDKEAF